MQRVEDERERKRMEGMDMRIHRTGKEDTEEEVTHRVDPSTSEDICSPY